MARRRNKEKNKLNKGIHRNADGVVVARETRHPLAHYFRSVPMGEGLPDMSMTEHTAQVLAMHVFDNLDCSAPRQPRYKAIPPEHGPDVWDNPPRWVPIKDEAEESRVGRDPVEDPDFDASRVPALDELTDDELDVLESRLLARRNQLVQEENLDGAGFDADPAAGAPEGFDLSKEPEWVQRAAGRMAATEGKIRAQQAQAARDRVEAAKKRADDVRNGVFDATGEDEGGDAP
ncbi:hypothetical protein [Tsukamurella pseudospumae]|uniref:Uncharacterized protein n=1 Tax=Tsukamurella pseudospumae TaxID=239498 RepID=A0A137ZRT1_9ACTN|nr:hypothetical protein [Tsukamurella pseudospumae]KXP00912.1 hypothetical protein AXK61_12955 [Tsukamurella pseudospumae]